MPPEAAGNGGRSADVAQRDLFSGLNAESGEFPAGISGSGISGDLPVDLGNITRP